MPSHSAPPSSAGSPIEPEFRRARREERRRQIRRRRRLALLALVSAVVLVGIVTATLLRGGDDGGGDGERASQGAATAAAAAPEPPKPPELPRGGRRIFPDHRIVAFYGAPQAEELGILGIGTPTRAARRLRDQAREYRRGGRTILPAFNLLATIASGAPGEDGMWRARQDASTIDRYHRAARRADALLILDIQPGQAEFMTEVRRLRRWLKEPDVGLALDPEWSMEPGQTPGQVIGRTDAATVNRVSRYLADIVRDNDLPEKVLLVHQFTLDMIRDRPRLRRREGVALTLNVDGFGNQGQKLDKYRAFTTGEGARHHVGYKLFYKEDTDLMTPSEVLRMRPRPDLVMYE